MGHSELLGDWAAQETEAAQIKDPRSRQSLAQICECLALNSGVSFSAGLGSRLRQSAHRIIEKKEITPANLLIGHQQETVKRSLEHSFTLVIQDTTGFDYTSHKATTGLGSLPGNCSGLLSHDMLAVSPEGEPLGVLGMSIWARDPEETGLRKTRNHRPTSQKESQKWIWGLQTAEKMFPPSHPLILVQDREADVFAFLAAPRRLHTNLLIRACRPRMVTIGTTTNPIKLTDAIDAAPIQGSFEILVPRKAGQKERKATLELRYFEAMAQPPANQLPGEPTQEQRVWVIHVQEIQSSAEEEPISWTLLSTLPVNSFEEARCIVSYYTLRWLIERLHFVLKSGCKVEHLQIDDAHALSNALAIYYMVAWRIMYTTYIARIHPDSPAEQIFTADEFSVLNHIGKTVITTVDQALLAVAKLGGYSYYKNAPPPGVKVVWIGFRKLEAMAQGWALATSVKTACLTKVPIQD